MAPNLNQGAILQGPKAVIPTPLNPVILTPPSTVKSPSPMPSPQKRNRPEEMNTSQPEGNVPTVPTPVQQPPAIIPATPMQAPSLEPTAKVLAPNVLSTTTTYTPAPSSLSPSILTPPPSVKSRSPMPSPPKRKRQRIHFVNYLDDDESIQKRRSRRLKSQSHPYKYAKQEERVKNR